MIKIYFGLGSPVVKLAWSVYKGSCGVLEDFSRANVFLWVIGAGNKFLVPCTTEDGVIEAELPRTLPVGVYGIRAIWEKDNCCKRALSEVQKVFAVTDVADAASPCVGDEMTIKVKSCTATFGYDGLDAYEMSVLHGKTVLSEEEWLDQLNGGSPTIDSFTTYPSTVEKNVATSVAFQVNVSTSVSRIEVKQGETVIGSGSGSTLAFTYNVTATSNASIPFTAYAYQGGLLVDQESVSVAVTETRYGYVGGGVTYEDAMNDGNKVTNFGSGTRTYNAHADQGDYYWFIFPEGVTVTGITAYGFMVPFSDKGIVTVGGKNYRAYQNNDLMYAAEDSVFSVTFGN